MSPQETSVTRGGERGSWDCGKEIFTWYGPVVTEYYYAVGQYFIYMKVSKRFMWDGGGHYQSGSKVLHRLVAARWKWWQGYQRRFRNLDLTFWSYFSSGERANNWINWWIMYYPICSKKDVFQGHPSNRGPWKLQTNIQFCGRIWFFHHTLSITWSQNFYLNEMAPKSNMLIGDIWALEKGRWCALRNRE